MKKRFIAIGALMSAWCLPTIAAEIDSGVIHNYSFIGAGYGYLHDIGGSGTDAHGAIGALSFEENNFVLSAGGGYFWGDDDVVDVDLWNANASLGYVIRMAENHINIIPSFGGGYGEVSAEFPGGFEATDESWSILPAINLSFAINNRFAINGGYTFAYNLDVEEETHVFNAGAKFALLEKVGLAAGATFTDEDGFSGATAAIEFHF